MFEQVQAKTRDHPCAAAADGHRLEGHQPLGTMQTVLDTLVRNAAELVDVARLIISAKGRSIPTNRAFIQPRHSSLIRENPISPGRETLAGRVALSGRVESIPDVLEDAEFSPTLKAAIQVRSILGVPLLRDDRVEGMMILVRTEPGPFAPRQIELVRTFADQAVIAIGAPEGAGQDARP
jgi:GAF domain-containing protein